MVICENCENEHDGSYGSGRFCCLKCARAFSTKYKRSEINKAISASLKRKPTIVCPICLVEFVQKKKRKFCSRSCSQKANWKKAEYRSELSLVSKERAAARIEGGTFPSFSSRSKIERSYPEKVVKKYLVENGITTFVEELKQSKYFIDFAFTNKMVALEIDGSQHEQEDRRLSDMKKDKVLEQLGWKVIRIKWISPKSSKFPMFLEELRKVKDLVT